MTSDPREPRDDPEGTPAEPAEPEEPHRSPWVGRGLVAAALGLWGGVFWLRTGVESGLQVRPAEVTREDPADVAPEAAAARGHGEEGEDGEEGEEGEEGEDGEEKEAGAEPLAALAGALAAAKGAGDDAAAAADTTPRDPRDRLRSGSWTRDLPAVDVVRYTVKRGGSLKTIANLYKIFHHEIVALNPGVDLERELHPGTKVILWRRPGDDFVSESVGYAGDGSLVGGVPMVDGPGRSLRMEPWKSYATADNVAILDAILRRWASRFPEDRPLLVGNMSAAKGGRLKPHSTHRSGRDVDLSYPQKPAPGEEEYNWREMGEHNLDTARTWDLLELLVESGAVELILIDSRLQKLLYDDAVAHGRVPRGELGFWLEYPRSPGSAETIVRHHPGHVDHLHVRFKCRPHEGRCRSRDRE